MKKSFFITLLLAVFILSVNCFGEDKIKFGSFPIPLMVVDSQNGVFIELSRTIAKKGNLKIDIKIKPPKRIITDFMKGKVDVLFPALDIFFPKGKEPAKSSELIYVKSDYVFTKKGSKMLRTIKDLEVEGKKVGITRGYPYVLELINNKKIKLELTKSDDLNAKKLVRGKIRAFVVEEKSGLKSFMNLGLSSKMQYDKRTPMSRQDVYFAFQNNAKGKKLSKLISKVLKSMKKDGSFGNIMKKASGN